ncbi:MAG TPA: hypothetical protein PKN08_12735, partial [Opitutaceae bacterium]|nr:hypothetical protein [Opitutaceae bacterium]
CPASGDRQTIHAPSCRTATATRPPAPNASTGLAPSSNGAHHAIAGTGDGSAHAPRIRSQLANNKRPPCAAPHSIHAKPIAPSTDRASATFEPVATIGPTLSRHDTSS